MAGGSGAAARRLDLRLHDGRSRGNFLAHHFPDRHKTRAPHRGHGEPLRGDDHAEFHLAISIERAEPVAAGLEAGTADALLAALHDPSDQRRQHDLYELVQRMSPAEVSAAIATAQSLSRKDRSILLPFLTARWAETDPKAAAQFVLGLDSNSRYGPSNAVFGVWVKSDLPGAMAWAQALPLGEQRDNALQNLVGQMARQDPATALQYLTSLPRSRVTDNIYYNVFNEWAGREPTAAASQALLLPRGQIRENALRATAYAWASIDPSAALAWAGQITEPGLRLDMISSTYSSWAGSDFAAASAAMLALPDGELKTRVLTNTAQTFSYRNPLQALGLLEKLPSGMMKSNAMMNAVGNLANSDPQAAARYVETMPMGDSRNNAARNVASNWARNDPSAALDWTESLPPGEARRNARQSVFWAWGQNDPRAAGDYWLKTSAGSGAQDDGTLAQIVTQWSRNDSGGALSWARGLADGATKDSALAAVAGSIASTDPRQAAAIFSQLSSAGQNTGAPQIAQQWAMSDAAGAAGAAKWTMTLPEGDGRNQAMRNVASQYASQDLVKAAEWLEKLPGGPSRDAAVSAFTGQATESDPAGAAAWASTIEDSQQRTADLLRIASSWMNQDRNAARAWIAKTTVLPVNIKQQLLGTK